MAPLPQLDRKLVITRTFDAPSRLVFDAWTTPELSKQLWAPKSRAARPSSRDQDVRVGGRLPLGVRSPQGHGAHGVLRQVPRSGTECPPSCLQLRAIQEVQEPVSATAYGVGCDATAFHVLASYAPQDRNNRYNFSTLSTRKTLLRASLRHFRLIETSALPIVGPGRVRRAPSSPADLACHNSYSVQEPKAPQTLPFGLLQETADAIVLIRWSHLVLRHH